MAYSLAVFVALVVNMHLGCTLFRPLIPQINVRNIFHATAVNFNLKLRWKVFA